MEDSKKNINPMAHRGEAEEQPRERASNREQLAKRLRCCTCLPEYRLWEALSKAEQQARFLRQQIIDEFIVDIYCPDYKLVIEVDGDVHDLKYGQNSRRHKLFESLGLRYLQVSNMEIKRDLARMVAKIKAFA